MAKSTCGTGWEADDRNKNGRRPKMLTTEGLCLTHSRSQEKLLTNDLNHLLTRNTPLKFIRRSYRALKYISYVFTANTFKSRLRASKRVLKHFIKSWRPHTHSSN